LVDLLEYMMMHGLTNRKHVLICSKFFDNVLPNKVSESYTKLWNCHS